MMPYQGLNKHNQLSALPLICEFHIFPRIDNRSEGQVSDISLCRRAPLQREREQSMFSNHSKFADLDLIIAYLQTKMADTASFGLHKYPLTAFPEW
jgi:hypothetical protein